MKMEMTKIKMRIRITMIQPPKIKKMILKIIINRLDKVHRVLLVHQILWVILREHHQVILKVLLQVLKLHHSKAQIVHKLLTQKVLLMLLMINKHPPQMKVKNSNLNRKKHPILPKLLELKKIQHLWL